MEVLVDGGIRRGADIIKALALGARAVMLGRGYAYGMAAAGEAGNRPGALHFPRRSGAHHEAAGLRLGRGA